MARHANKPTRATRKSRLARHCAVPMNRTAQAPITDGSARLEMQRLDCFGVHESLAVKWFAAIACDDLDLSTAYAQKLRREGVDPFGLRCLCRVFESSGATEGVADAFKLAHRFRSKLVITWLISWVLEAQAEQTFVALTNLSHSFGDGQDGSPAVNFARQVFEALFVPKTLDEIREHCDDLPAGSIVGPHVERFVREACLSFMA